MNLITIDFSNIAFSSDEKPNDRNNIESEAEEEFNNNQNNNNKKEETLNENKDEEVFEGRMKFVKTNEKNTKKIGIVDYAKKDLSALKVLNKFVNENVVNNYICKNFIKYSLFFKKGSN